MGEDLIKAIANLREEEALIIVQNRLDSGEDLNEILENESGTPLRFSN